ncbi:hypothetical protein KP509_28G021500 [Ceratopteris richardii]|uniref:Endonuclease/exonuclease/phosphatase domain-containing protein n=1 Tax=Ceratopteris richardii TaxID=49495 RepID=A0A8T2RAB6_CERRI|nr:hypothetical protein KP509_28G021500 [Ceratopteris richardii]
MKIATWNIQGLGQPGKWTRLWRWIVRHQLHLVAVQEHKKHDIAGMLVHTKDFQLQYNGMINRYLGCLFIIRKNINFTVLFDDPQGRFIIVHLMLHGTSFVCINVYAPNSPAERMKTWKELVLSIQYCMQLQIWGEARILLCGDFNMVESEVDCTTTSSVMSSQESASWNEILNMSNCKDLWGYIGGHTLRYTFHSRSHRKAMSKLERCYYSHVYTLKAISKMWIDATVLLFDHNPLLISLEEVDWKSCIPRNLPRIPLRVNHSWMQTSLFKSKNFKGKMDKWFPSQSPLHARIRIVQLLRFLSIWDSSYTFKMKLFMWRDFVGHFKLGAFLNKHGVLGIRCPHCTSYVENMRHAFRSSAYTQKMVEYSAFVSHAHQI